ALAAGAPAPSPSGWMPPLDAASASPTPTTRRMTMAPPVRARRQVGMRMSRLTSVSDRPSGRASIEWRNRSIEGRASRPPPDGARTMYGHLPSASETVALTLRGGSARVIDLRGVEQRQLVGLITRRSEVRILPPQ